MKNKLTLLAFGISTVAMIITTVTNIQTTINMKRLHDKGYTHKEAVMEMVGYNKCLVTGIYDWGNKDDWVEVWYTSSRGVIVPPGAIKMEGIENLVYDFVIKEKRATPKETSPEQIKFLNNL